MGAAVVDRLYKPGWQNRAETRIGHSRACSEHDSAAGAQGCRRASSPVESRKGNTLLRDFLPGVRGQVFCPEFLPHVEALDPATLSPHTRQTPFTCFWTLSPLRHRNARFAAVRAAENGERFGMGMRRPLPQPDVEDLRDRQEMGLLCRRQSR